MGSVVDAFTGDTKPKYTPSRESYNVPYADDLRVRYLAILDSYLKEKGIDALIPPTSRPYELRTPEEQEGLRNEYVYQQGLPEEEFKPPLPSIPKWAPWVPLTQAESQTPEKRKEEKAPEEEASYASPEIATSLVGNRLGVTRDVPEFSTSRESYEADEERRKKQLNDIHRFIYGASRGSRG